MSKTVLNKEFAYMREGPPLTRTAYFLRPVEARLYKDDWKPIIGSEQTERMLIGSLTVREAETDVFRHKGTDYSFYDVGVHAWVDAVADGICLEVKMHDAQVPECLFVNRTTLLDKFPNTARDVAVFTSCLEPTARAVWLNMARPLIPPGATIFARGVPLEEHYGFQALVWGNRSREIPVKAEMLRRALDPAALHIKLYARFRAL
jgi:hypothetical protein